MHKLSFFKMSTSLYFITVSSVLFFYSVLLVHRLLFVVPLIWETLLLCKPFLGHCNGKLPIEIVRKQMLSSFFFFPSFFFRFFLLFGLLFQFFFRGFFNRCPPAARTIHTRKQSRHCCFFSFRFSFVGLRIRKGNIFNVL